MGRNVRKEIGILSRSEAGRREMRKQMAGTMIALLAIVLMGTAQTPGTEAATHAALQKVNVVRGETGVSIEMVSKGTLAPKVETLSSPARIVVNLPNTTMATSLNRINVGTGGVAAVRIGADANATTRVVVDLDRPAKYELVSGANGSLTLKVASPAVVAKAASLPAKPSSPVAAP